MAKTALSENVYSSESKSCRLSNDVFLPLELTKSLHICLWSEDNSYKWTIGYFEQDDEGPWFKFVGDRPLDERVNWNDFHEMIRLGYSLAEHAFGASKKSSID
jgi:hypothetical protein